jgi:hypothetical protein
MSYKSEKGKQKMLSRKYYRMLADVIKTSNDIEELKKHLIKELKADNYNFNIDLFLKACEK